MNPRFLKRQIFHYNFHSALAGELLKKQLQNFKDGAKIHFLQYFFKAWWHQMACITLMNGKGKGQSLVHNSKTMKEKEPGIKQGISTYYKGLLIVLIYRCRYSTWKQR